MWSIALLFSLAAAHPHHGLKHSGGKKIVAVETPEIECPTQQPTDTILPHRAHCVSVLVTRWGGMNSVGVHVILGNAGANNSRSAPVPALISAASPTRPSPPGRYSMSALRIGTRLRSALG